MIMGKFGTAIRAFFNKLANLLWESDPHAILQLEVDQATQQIQVAREGLERYRGLVERVSMQVAAAKQNAQRLESQIKAHLQAGNREVAGQLAIQLQQVKQDQAANEQQLAMHTDAYNNNLLKLQQGQKDIAALRQKAQKLKADLEMAKAEAEIARVAEAVSETAIPNFSTKIGQATELMEEQIAKHRGAARVAADMSSRGVEDIKAQQAAEAALGENLLKQFEVELGLVNAESAPVTQAQKTLGPTQTN
ncbi:MAG: PspA/IM30 family protein [Gemmatimonadaceae bacterium]